MRSKPRILFMAAAVIGVTGCAESLRLPIPREVLRDTGIFGEHALRRTEQLHGPSGKIAGSFFLASGSLSGKLSSEPALQFYWEPKKDEIVVTSLPYSKFRFVTDASKKVPTIEFVFDAWIDKPNAFAREALEKNLNVNDVIMGEHLSVAIVHISAETLEKEIYLPRPSK
jgi:hypothetical protein